MKALRVCLSSELPGLLDRKSDYLYFLYDKLFLYNGQNIVDADFCIIDAIPEEQVDGMIYILNTDGSVHRKVDYVDTVVAEIEDASQIELLKKAGTMYYVNSDHRYMDSQRRTLTLPYNNGNYELTVAAKNDAKFNNNTILKYNENDERFELFGEQDEEFIDFSKPFRGKDSNTVKVTVDGPKISAAIKISKAVGNILKASSDGLLVKPLDFVDKDTFDKWIYDVSDFKKYAQAVLDRVDAELSDIKKLVTPDSIKAEILDQLKQKYHDIETAIDNYQHIVDSLDTIESDVMTYASTNISNASITLNRTVAENSEWNELDDSHETYTSEIDYYKKAEAYYYPEFTRTQRLAIIGMAMSKYFEDTVDRELVVSIAMAKYMEDLDESNRELIATIAMGKYLSEEENN